MGNESRLELMRKVKREWDTKRSEKGRDTGLWYLVKFDDRKSNPFGSWFSPRTNTWNHEWCEQFKYYVNEVEGKERWIDPNDETNSSSYWDEMMIPLMEKERKTFDSDEEFETRLNEVRETRNSYL